MPEDAAPREQLAEALENADTPDAPEPTSGPEAGDTATEADEASTPAVDWQERYTNLQPEYTRATQEAAQLRQIIDAAREGDPEALQILGWEAEAEDDDEPEYDDPDERWEQRFDQIEGYLEQQAAAQAEAEVAELEQRFFDQEITAIEGKEKAEFSAQERKAIEGLADRMRDEDGIPDVEGAYQLLSEAADAKHKRYVKSKKAPNVELGAAGTDKVNLADDEARVDLLANMIEAGNQADA